MCAGCQLIALVGGQQPVLDLAAWRCTTTAWRSRAAACRSASSAGRRARSCSARRSLPRVAQVLDQVGVGVLDPAAGVGADPLVVGAVQPHRVDHRAGRTARRGGSRPRRRRSPVWTSPVPSSAVTKSAEQHGVAALAVRSAGDEVERRLVTRRRPARRRGSARAISAPSPNTLLEQRLGDDAPTSPSRGPRARRSARDPRRRRRWRPASTAWSSRPAARRRRWTVRGPARPGSARRPTGRHVPVGAGLAELVAGERGPAARAVGDDLELLVEQALVADRLQRPPDRLDVGRCRASCRRRRGRSRSRSARSAGSSPRRELNTFSRQRGVELGDPVRSMSSLRVMPSSLLDGELDRQAVAVPAALALDAVAAHRLVAGKMSLKTRASTWWAPGHAVGRRRALVEDPRSARPGGGATRRRRRARASARGRPARGRGRTPGVDGAVHGLMILGGRPPGTPSRVRPAGVL